MQAIGALLDQTLIDNPKSIRIFSPDELVSNKLDAVFNHTTRNFQWTSSPMHAVAESLRFFPSIRAKASFKVIL